MDMKAGEGQRRGYCDCNCGATAILSKSTTYVSLLQRGRSIVRIADAASARRFQAVFALARKRQHLEAASFHQRAFLEHPVGQAQPAAYFEEAGLDVRTLRIDDQRGRQVELRIARGLERRALAHLDEFLRRAEVQARRVVNRVPFGLEVPE